ncbi:glycosyltransferase [Candidatus Pelagibacter sp.]|nr:glycosyltransferase [Candidatus Pelagibacter sp.]
MIVKKRIQGGLRSKGVFKNCNNMNPLISVITVVLNGERYLEEAILSVIKQTHKNVEYIIIDGGSTDGTLDIIRKYDDRIDFWISEKDNGLYNAMNKGINLSNGDFIGFVGSDDFLYPNTLEKIAKASTKASIDFTVGPVDIIKVNGKLKEKILILPRFLENNRFVFDMATHHLSFYVSRKIINKIGIFDESFNIRSDYDMTINVMSLSKKHYSFKESVGAFREGGLSGSYKSYLESFRILRKHGISILKSVINITSSLAKLFIIKNLPPQIVNLLRKKFSSGRFIQY